MEESLEAAHRSFKELRFVVIGAYVADCFVAAPRLPAWGEDYEARSIRSSPGGKALNQAVALARLGVQVSAIGAVGGDGLGRDVVSALSREGVGTEFFVTREGAATSICICFVGDDGQTSFVWHIDDDVAVTCETVRSAEPAIRQADAVLVTFEAPVAAIREALILARRCGARVFVQPAPPLADHGAAASLPWENVDVLIPNEVEARAVLEGLAPGRQGVHRDDVAAELASGLCVPLVVVTLGDEGCVTYSSAGRRSYPAQQAAVLDTTGASDAFTATLAAHLAGGRPEAVAIKAATAAAATSIGSLGGYESMPPGF